MAAAPIQVENKRGGCTTSVAAAPPDPIQVEISVAVALPDLRFRVSAQPPFSLRISVAAAPPDAHSG